MAESQLTGAGPDIDPGLLVAWSLEETCGLTISHSLSYLSPQHSIL